MNSSKLFSPAFFTISVSCSSIHIVESNFSNDLQTKQRTISFASPAGIPFVTNPFNIDVNDGVASINLLMAESCDLAILLKLVKKATGLAGRRTNESSKTDNPFALL